MKLDFGAFWNVFELPGEIGVELDAFESGYFAEVDVRFGFLDAEWRVGEQEFSGVEFTCINIQIGREVSFDSMPELIQIVSHFFEFCGFGE